MNCLNAVTRLCRVKVQGVSLLESIVAAVIFLSVFTAVLELLPYLTIRDDNVLRVVQAEYLTSRMLEKYCSETWPEGNYAETYDWGRIEIRIERYRTMADARKITVSVHIEGCREKIELTQVVIGKSYEMGY